MAARKSKSARVSKAQLKHLIKECILEVLMDGFGQDERLDEAMEVLHEQRSRPAPVRQQPRRQQPVQQRPYYPAAQMLEQPQHRPQVSDKYGPVTPGPVHQRPTIAEALGPVAQNPIMASIFADTAQTTLRDQPMDGAHGQASAPMNERAMVAPGSDAAQYKASQIDPTQIAGSDNWARAAGLPDA